MKRYKSTSKKNYYGLLTEREYTVLKLRAQELTQREVAEILGVSRTTVSALERSAKRKILLAEKTLIIYRELLSRAVFVINSGTRLVEIPAIILRRADELGIKLKGDFTYIYSQLRYRVGVKKPILDRDIKVVIYKNGEFEILPAD
jgi:Tfx family DNA-binding protein